MVGSQPTVTYKEADEPGPGCCNAISIRETLRRATSYATSADFDDTPERVFSECDTFM
jgi:hypothetical protein